MLKQIISDALYKKKKEMLGRLEEEKKNYAKYKLMSSVGKHSRAGKEYENISNIIDNIEKMGKFIDSIVFKVNNSLIEEYDIRILRDKKELQYNENILERENREIVVIVLSEIYLSYGAVYINTYRLGNLIEVTKERLEVNRVLTEDYNYKRIKDNLNRGILGILQSVGYIDTTSRKHLWINGYLDLYNCFYNDNLKIPDFSLSKVKKVRENVSIESNSISIDYVGRLIIK